VNLSGRAFTQAGDKASIGGFIVKGSGFKRVIVRGLGPSMSANGKPVPGALADPVLELHDSNGSVRINDNWRDTQESEIQQSGLAPKDDREAAIIVNVPAGSYTGIVRGSGGNTGVGLVEIYDLGVIGGATGGDPGDGPSNELGNLAVRADVQTGDNVLIDGLILAGGAPKRVLVRALGPSNRTQVPDSLGDPTLELHDGNGTTIGTNDNWRDAPNAAEIESTGLQPPHDKEPAILTQLSAGNYTAVVQGVNGTTGIAVAEAYRLTN
jgi:hypothetical protein